jgi:hypothetical protein
MAGEARIVKGCLAFLLTTSSASFLACDDDQGPRLEIINPSAGERVELGSDMRVDVDIFVRDFDIDTVGKCAGESDPCGQVVLNIDGDACNAPGSPYNSILDHDRTEIEADFALCPAETRLGNHTITVSLLQQGQPATKGSGTVAASITVTTEP